ncbi:hypothetical protein TNCT_367071, partial [Trichonephila clavata]
MLKALRNPRSTSMNFCLLQNLCGSRNIASQVHSRSVLSLTNKYGVQRRY